MLRTIDAVPRPAAGDEDEGTPVSVKIRERLLAARKRFNANDNIAEFIEPGELEGLLDEVEGKMKHVLESLVIDLDNDHNTATAASTQHAAPPRCTSTKSSRAAMWRRLR